MIFKSLSISPYSGLYHNKLIGFVLIGMFHHFATFYSLLISSCKTESTDKSTLKWISCSCPWHAQSCTFFYFFVLVLLSLLTPVWSGHLGSHSDSGSILAVRRCNSTWASICCVCLPNGVRVGEESGGCAPLRPPPRSHWTQTDKRGGLHSWARRRGPTVPAWEIAAPSLHSRSQKWLDAHTSKKSSFCFMRCMADRARSTMLWVFISLPLHEALNHWFNKQGPGVLAGAVFQVEMEQKEAEREVERVQRRVRRTVRGRNYRSDQQKLLEAA